MSFQLMLIRPKNQADKAVFRFSLFRALKFSTEIWFFLQTMTIVTHDAIHDILINKTTKETSPHFNHLKNNKYWVIYIEWISHLKFQNFQVTDDQNFSKFYLIFTPNFFKLSDWLNGWELHVLHENVG